MALSKPYADSLRSHAIKGSSPFPSLETCIKWQSPFHEKIVANNYHHVVSGERVGGLFSRFTRRGFDLDGDNEATLSLSMSRARYRDVFLGGLG